MGFGGEGGQRPRQGWGGGRHFPKIQSRVSPQSPHRPSLHHQRPITAASAPPRWFRLRVVCQLSDRKRPRPASPEAAIYLYFVPCQSFMLLSSEIRLSLCWCYAACFAQQTPRGATELVDQ